MIRTNDSQAIRAGASDAGPPSPHPLVGTIWLFSALVAGALVSAHFTNEMVLTDDVYRTMLEGRAPPDQVEALLDVSDQWALLGYALTPVSLGLKVGLVALVVQLGLLVLRVEAPLSRVFRAAVWAQFAILGGSAVRSFWLGSLPEAARTAERIERAPGSGEWLLSGLGPFDPAVSGLLQQVSIYQIGWIVIFVLALERRDLIPAGPVVAVVVGAWVASTLTRWGIWMYLGVGGFA